MAAPSIPQRPARSQQSQNVPTIAGDIPKIPPRPKRNIERSVSPNRDSFARSPLNDPSFVNGSGNASKRLSASDLPARPPSVTLPSIGQEGSEYASLETPPADEETAPRQTRDAEGLKLYAPTAEMPQSTARSRIAAVTRTDSEAAAAVGFGRASSHGRTPSQSDTDRPTRTSSSTGRASRPQSLYNNGDEEHGIPEIGLQVPMYPNAGDVQAPTPSNSSMPATGIGFFNSGAQRHHTRSKSGREVFHGPPGSYGMHGHGVKPQDNFEKQWYAKHPEDAQREARGEYGPAIQDNRKDWALSSEELNKLVQDSAARGVGMGASPGAIGTPAEEIGYIATEEYASRMASPRPQSKTPTKERKTSSQTHAESPLRKMDFPNNIMNKNTSAIEADEEDVIHIDHPTNERSKIHGGGPEAENLGVDGGNTDARGGFVTEEGHGAPILASDELERHKTPGAEYMQPAVPPELERERRLSQEADSHRRSGSRPTSRPTSGVGLSRWKSQGDDDRTGTPLDNVKEYEPLFPEDDEKKSAQKPVTAADKLKRPDLARHHFPSQDVWEDTPSSLQLQTEVETPEVPDEPQSATTSLQSSQILEKPEDNKEREAEAAPKEEEHSFLPDHHNRSSKPRFNKDVLGDMPARPGMQQRFPSQDIWEDTPEHHQLVTEVQAPQTDEIESPVEPKSAVEERPQVPARPHVPSRPAGRSKMSESQSSSPAEKKAPTLPERPKPQVPVRPARPGHKASDEQVPLSKVTSGGSTGSEEAGVASTKPKPPVPSRPGGSKIAALKAGFLSDLNSRLQLGPQAPKPKKEEEEEKEEQQVKAPLADARKGRARGPARRKPAASPAAAAAADSAEKKSEQVLSIGTIRTVFSISDDGDVQVAASKPAQEKKPEVVEEKKKSEAVEEKEPELAQEKIPEAAKASIATQVPADPKPAPSDSPAEPELAPEIPKAGETEATRINSDLATETEEKETELAPTVSKSSDSAAQTGQQDVEIPKAEGGVEKLTAYVGGRAPEEGTVVVKDGVETVGDADGKHGIEQTGSGI